MAIWLTGQPTPAQRSIRPLARFPISKFQTATNGIVADLLVDTDIFVDHLRGAARLQLGTDRVLYSVVTRCELFAGHATEEGAVRQLLAPFEEVPVDRPIAEGAGRLRRKGGLRTPDALIAATALEHRLVLVTRNERDFQAVRGLKVRQPR